MRLTKLVAAVFGVLLVIGSFAVTVAGGIAVTMPDGDGWVTAGPFRVETESVGVLAEDIEVDLGDHVGDRGTFVGWDAIPARFEITSRNDKEVFIGIATATDARAYLSGTAFDSIESWRFHHEPDLQSIAGTMSVTPPGTQDIWVAASTNGTLEWDVSDGEWAVVILNADGSAGLEVALRGAAQVPFLRAIGVVLIVAGIVGMTGGGVLTYFGVRRVRSAHPAATTPPQPLATN